MIKRSFPSPPFTVSTPNPGVMVSSPLPVFRLSSNLPVSLIVSLPPPVVRLKDSILMILVPVGMIGVTPVVSKVMPVAILVKSSIR